MFHLLAMEEALAAGAASAELDAVADAEFSVRNNHFIFTEPYRMLMEYYQAATVTAARWNVPKINAIARHQIWPLNASATIPDIPVVADYRDYPIELPQFEEFVIEGSNSLGCGTENSTWFGWIAPPQWNRTIPRGIQRLTVAATGAVAGVAQSWSGLGNLTFTENLRGGVYALVGAQCFDAGTLALRFVFSRPYMYQGRKLRPGIICQEAIANNPLLLQMGGLGEFGRFHTFEPPQIEIFANATGASAQVIRLDLVYLGDNPAML